MSHEKATEPAPKKVENDSEVDESSQVVSESKKTDAKLFDAFAELSGAPKKSGYEWHQKGATDSDTPVDRVAQRGIVKDTAPKDSPQQSVTADGKINTKLGKAILEFDPKNTENPYALIDENGERKVVKGADRVTPDGQTLDSLIEKGIKSEDIKDGESSGTRTAYPDGTIKTVYKEPKPGQPSVVTDYPANNGPEGASKVATFNDDPHGRERVAVSKIPQPSQTTTFKDGHSETFVQKGDKPVPESMSFPAHEGDPRGTSKQTFRADSVETTFQNAFDVGGVKVKSLESRADGSTVFKGEDGKALNLQGEQLANAEAHLLNTPLHEFTTPAGDKISFMADGQRTDFAKTGEEGQELSRRQYTFPRTMEGTNSAANGGIVIDSQFAPSQAGPDRVLVYANSSSERFKDGQPMGAPQEEVQVVGSDVQVRFGTGDYAGTVRYRSDSGIPQTMAIGNREYQMQYGADGRINNLTVNSPDGKLELRRDEQGQLHVARAEGRFQPQANGAVNLEGLPVTVRDGKIVGDIEISKTGDVRYKTSEGPQRQEFVRRADGTMDHFDMASWKRTRTQPGGQPQVTYWTGYEWAAGQPSQDGKRIDFAPDPNNPDKPTFVMRASAEGPPAVDRTVFGYQNGRTLDADWQGRTQTERIQGPPASETTRYYDGSAYREAASAQRDADGNLRVQFKEPQRGQPIETIYAKNGKVQNTYADQTRLVKDSRGFIESINGPRGNYSFERDPDGDIRQMTQYGPADASGKPVVLERFTRSGQERNAGMERWLSRNSINGMQMPVSERPPRDMSKPPGYNTFINSKGEQVSFNVNVTADGSIRREYPGDGTPYFAYDRIEADNFKEIGGRAIFDRPGGVTEIQDKSKNPPEQEVIFKRNGIDYNLKSKDGRIIVGDNGLVSQFSPGEKSFVVHTTEGAVAKANMPDANNISFTEVKLPLGNGQFKTLAVGQDNVKSVSVRPDGKIDADIGEDKFIINLKNNTVAQKEGDYLRVRDMKTNEAKSITDLEGRPLWEFSADGITGPTGNTFKSADWDTSNAKLVGNELELTSKDQKYKARLRMDGSSVERRDGKDYFTYADKTKAVLDSTNGKLESVLIGGKEYVPNPAVGADGRITELKAKAGDERLKPVPADATFKFDYATGKFATEVSDNNGIKTRTVWNPDSNTYRIERNWNGAKNKEVQLSVTLDKDNQVLKFKLPEGSTKKDQEELVVAEMKKRSPALNVSFDKGVLNINSGDGVEGIYNPDGSYSWLHPGVNERDHFDAVNQLYAPPAEGTAIAAAIDKMASGEGDKKALEAFASSLIMKVQRTNAAENNLKNYIKGLNDNYLSKLKPAATISSTIGQDGSVTFVVSRDGKNYTHKVGRTPA